MMPLGGDNLAGEEAYFIGRERGAYCTCAYRACGVTFKTLEALERHIVTNHNMSWDSYTKYTAGKGEEVEDDDETTSKRKDAYCVCTYMECGRKFKTLKALEEHVVLYHNISWQNYTMYYHRWVRKGEPSSGKDTAKSPVKASPPKPHKEPDRQVGPTRPPPPPPPPKPKVATPSVEVSTIATSISPMDPIQSYLTSNQMMAIPQVGSYPYYGAQYPVVTPYMTSPAIPQMVAPPMWGYASPDQTGVLPIPYPPTADYALPSMDMYGMATQGTPPAEILNLSQDSDKTQPQVKRQPVQLKSNMSRCDDKTKTTQEELANSKQISTESTQRKSSDIEKISCLYVDPSNTQTGRGESLLTGQDCHAAEKTFTKAEQYIEEKMFPKMENGMFVIEPKAEFQSRENSRTGSVTPNIASPASSRASSRLENPLPLSKSPGPWSLTSTGSRSQTETPTRLESLDDNKYDSKGENLIRIRKKAKTVREFLEESQSPKRNLANEAGMFPSDAGGIFSPILLATNPKEAHLEKRMNSFSIDNLIGTNNEEPATKREPSTEAIRSPVVHGSPTKNDKVKTETRMTNKVKVRRLPVKVEMLFMRYLKKKYNWLSLCKQKWGQRKCDFIKLLQRGRVKRIKSLRGKELKLSKTDTVKYKERKTSKNKYQKKYSKNFPSYFWLYKQSKRCLGSKEEDRDKCAGHGKCTKCRKVIGKLAACQQTKHRLCVCHNDSGHRSMPGAAHILPEGSTVTLPLKSAKYQVKHGDVSVQGLLGYIKDRCDSPLKVLSPEEQQLQAERSFCMLGDASVKAEEIKHERSKENFHGENTAIELSRQICDGSVSSNNNQSELQQSMKKRSSHNIDTSVSQTTNMERCSDQSNKEKGSQMTPKWPIRIEQLQSQADVEKRPESTESPSTTDSRDSMDHLLIDNIVLSSVCGPEYKCMQCGLSYYGNKDYLSHLFEDHQMYRCEECESERRNSSHIYRYQETIQSHLEVEHGINDCDTDISKFMSKNIFSGPDVKGVVNVVRDLDKIVHITQNKVYFSTGFVLQYQLHTVVTSGEKSEKQHPLVIFEVTDVSSGEPKRTQEKVIADKQDENQSGQLMRNRTRQAGTGNGNAAKVEADDTKGNAIYDKGQDKVPNSTLQMEDQMDRKKGYKPPLTWSSSMVSEDGDDENKLVIIENEGSESPKTPSTPSTPTETAAYKAGPKKRFMAAFKQAQSASNSPKPEMSAPQSGSEDSKDASDLRTPSGGNTSASRSSVTSPATLNLRSCIDSVIDSQVIRQCLMENSDEDSLPKPSSKEPELPHRKRSYDQAETNPVESDSPRRNSPTTVSENPALSNIGGIPKGQENNPLMQMAALASMLPRKPDVTGGIAQTMAGPEVASNNPVSANSVPPPLVRVDYVPVTVASATLGVPSSGQSQLYGEHEALHGPPAPKKPMMNHGAASTPQPSPPMTQHRNSLTPTARTYSTIQKPQSQEQRPWPPDLQPRTEEKWPRSHEQIPGQNVSEQLRPQVVPYHQGKNSHPSAGHTSVVQAIAGYQDRPIPQDVKEIMRERIPPRAIGQAAAIRHSVYHPSQLQSRATPSVSVPSQQTGLVQSAPNQMRHSQPVHLSYGTTSHSHQARLASYPTHVATHSSQPSKHAHSPHGNPGHSPHGNTGHSPHGNPGHSPHGNPGHSPHGNPSHSPHGNPGHSPHGNPGHSPHGNPSHSPHGNPGHSPHGNPGHSPHGNPGHSPHGNPSHSPHGNTGHSPYGHSTHSSHAPNSHFKQGSTFHSPHLQTGVSHGRNDHSTHGPTRHSNHSSPGHSLHNRTQPRQAGHPIHGRSSHSPQGTAGHLPHASHTVYGPSRPGASTPSTGLPSKSPGPPSTVPYQQAAGIYIPGHKTLISGGPKGLITQGMGQPPSNIPIHQANIAKPPIYHRNEETRKYPQQDSNADEKDQPLDLSKKPLKPQALPIHAPPEQNPSSPPSGDAPLDLSVKKDVPSNETVKTAQTWYPTRVPSHHLPRHQAPVHQAPVHRATVHQAPVHRATVHQAPVHQAPVHQAPASYPSKVHPTAHYQSGNFPPPAMHHSPGQAASRPAQPSPGQHQKYLERSPSPHIQGMQNSLHKHLQGIQKPYTAESVQCPPMMLQQFFSERLISPSQTVAEVKPRVIQPTRIRHSSEEYNKKQTVAEFQSPLKQEKPSAPKPLIGRAEPYVMVPRGEQINKPASQVASHARISPGSAVSRARGTQALLGNHPIDDILYLKCNVCAATYGSPHSFRKHFNKVHGFEPSVEHVTVRSISAAKGNTKVDTAQNSPYKVPHSGVSDISRPNPPNFPVSPGQSSNSGSPLSTPSPSVSQLSPATIDVKHEEDQKLKFEGHVHKPGEGSRSMQCFQCGQDFPTRDWGVFKRHMRAHESPQLRCNICRQTFQDENEFTDHNMTYHPIQSFPCRHCNVSFSHPAALSKHTKLVHPTTASDDTNLKCLYCPQTFLDPLLLANHIRMHEDSLAVPSVFAKDGQLSSSVRRASPDSTSANNPSETQHAATVKEEKPNTAVKPEGIPIFNLQVPVNTKIHKYRSMSILDIVKEKVEEESRKQLFGGNWDQEKKSDEKKASLSECLIEGKPLEKEEKAVTEPSEKSKSTEKHPVINISGSSVTKRFESGPSDVFRAVFMEISKTIEPVNRESQYEQKPVTDQTDTKKVTLNEENKISDDVGRAKITDFENKYSNMNAEEALSSIVEKAVMETLIQANVPLESEVLVKEENIDKNQESARQDIVKIEAHDKDEERKDGQEEATNKLKIEKEVQNSSEIQTAKSPHQCNTDRTQSDASVEHSEKNDSAASDKNIGPDHLDFNAKLHSEYETEKHSLGRKTQELSESVITNQLNKNSSQVSTVQNVQSEIIPQKEKTNASLKSDSKGDRINTNAPESNVMNNNKQSSYENKEACSVLNLKNESIFKENECLTSDYNRVQTASDQDDASETKNKILITDDSECINKTVGDMGNKVQDTELCDKSISDISENSGDIIDTAESGKKQPCSNTLKLNGEENCSTKSTQDIKIATGIREHAETTMKSAEIKTSQIAIAKEKDDMTLECDGHTGQKEEDSETTTINGETKEENADRKLSEVSNSEAKIGPGSSLGADYSESKTDASLPISVKSDSEVKSEMPSFQCKRDVQTETSPTQIDSKNGKSSHSAASIEESKPTISSDFQDQNSSKPEVEFKPETDSKFKSETDSDSKSRKDLDSDSKGISELSHESCSEPKPELETHKSKTESGNKNETESKTESNITCTSDSGSLSTTKISKGVRKPTESKDSVSESEAQKLLQVDGASSSPPTSVKAKKIADAVSPLKRSNSSEAESDSEILLKKVKHCLVTLEDISRKPQFAEVIQNHFIRLNAIETDADGSVN